LHQLPEVHALRRDRGAETFIATVTATVTITVIITVIATATTTVIATVTITVTKPMKRLLIAALVAALLPACAVYKIDIQQGNEITAAMLAELDLGMSKREVGKRLGFPLVTDPFHADRWDYYYYLKTGATGEVQQHSATLHFIDDALTRIDSALPGDDGDGGDN